MMAPSNNEGGADDDSNELATLTRVRNRLSSSPDAALPKILTGLLPRLLRRLEDYQQKQHQQTLPPPSKEEQESSTADHAMSNNSTTPVRRHQTSQLIIQQLTGILSQALERLEHNLTILPASPWMEAVLPFLSVTTTTTTTTVLTTTFALKFLQTGLARYQQEMTMTMTMTTTTHSTQQPPNTTLLLNSIALTLFRLVNVLYEGQHPQQQPHQQQQPPLDDDTNMEAEGTIQSSSSSLIMAQRTLWFMASWMCWDVMAMYQGMMPFQNWDTDVVVVGGVAAFTTVTNSSMSMTEREGEDDDDDDKEQHESKSEMTDSTTTNSAAAMTLAAKRMRGDIASTSTNGGGGGGGVAVGVLDLMLDVLLFWPQEPAAFHNEHHQQQQQPFRRQRREWIDPRIVVDRNMNDDTDDGGGGGGGNGAEENVPLPAIMPAVAAAAAAVEQQQQQQQQQQEQQAQAGGNDEGGLELQMNDDDDDEQEMQDDAPQEDPVQPRQQQRQQRQHPPLWPLVESKRGLSSEGVYRMNYRNDLVTRKLDRVRRGGIHNIHRRHEIGPTNSEWNRAAVFYLQQIKLASLQFGIGSPSEQDEGGGLFQGDTALFLAIVAMMSSAAQTPHARLAREYIMRLSRKSLLRLKPSAFLNPRNSSKRRSPMIVNHNTSNDLNRVSLALVCSLMILIIGDEAAAPVLKQYQASSSTRLMMLEEILGPRPNKSPESPHCRPPLPAAIAAPMMDFISSLFAATEKKQHSHGNLILKDLGDEQDARQGMMLLLDLILAGEHQFGLANLWTVHLVHGMFHLVKEQLPHNSDDEWIMKFQHNCLEIALDHLASTAQMSPDDDDTPQQPQELMPFGPPPRRDFDRLIQKHRNHQKKEILARSSAVQVREYTYSLISALAKETTAQHAVLRGEKVSFELADLLFICAELELVKSLVVVPLKHVLNVYRRCILEPDAMVQGVELEALAAPLLRTLVSASCSQSPVVRLAGAEWVSGLLSQMDPISAYTLGWFLADDPDPTVSQFMSRGTHYLLNDELKKARQIKDPPVEFVDMSDEVERSLVEAELDFNVQKLAETLAISLDAASLLLHDFHFNLEDVLQSTRSDRLGTLAKAGVLMRCNQNSITDKMEVDDTHVCGICYEDYSEKSLVYSLPCDHAFCLECWKGLVETAIEESPTKILKLACPDQDCSERLTFEDLQNIDQAFLPIWRKAYLRSFVERSKSRRRFCPGPDCTMVAVASLSPKTPASTCMPTCAQCSQCTTRFCLACGEPPHIPARCEDIAKFDELQLSSNFYVQKNTKPCPGCKAAVEKDGGCNAMFCPQCQTEFCWICLSLVDAHLAHTCNKYDPNSSSDVDRGAFYFGRYQAHNEGETFAQGQLTDLKLGAADISGKVWSVLEDRDITAFRRGLETLLRARRFLKYSYVYSHGNRSSNSSGGNNSSIFESYQAALEASTEGLGRLTELDLNDIYEDGGAQGIRSHFGAMGVYRELVDNSIQRMLALLTNSKSSSKDEANELATTRTV